MLTDRRTGLCKCKTTPVTEIGDLAFSENSITSITIPSSIKKIGEGAFYGNNSFRAVHINDLDAWLRIETYYNVSSLFNDGSNPLYYAEHLYLNGEEVTSIIIPEGCTSVQKGYFAGWSGLTSVTIPTFVTSIGDYAFSGCTGLTSVTSLIKEPFSISRVFDTSTYYSATLYVPAGTIDAYKATDGWNEFQTIKEIEDSVQPKGDLNGDGIVDVADIASVIDVMANGTNEAAADVNGDGTVDVADIAAVIDIMAGKS